MKRIICTCGRKHEVISHSVVTKRVICTCKAVIEY